MKIRSITSFIDPAHKNFQSDLEMLADSSRRLKQASLINGIEVQSTRLATTPFPLYLNGTSSENCQFIQELDERASSLGWNYLSLGPALPDFPESYPFIIEGLKISNSVFFGAIMAANGKIFSSAVKECAKIIHQAARLSSDGFANLRFAALANVLPYTPFLPAGYHAVGNPPAITVAVECADVVIESFSSNQELDVCRSKLLSRLENFAALVASIFNKTKINPLIEFRGFDFSPAPYPKDTCSLAGGLERIGTPKLGGFGSLAAAAILADSLDQGKWLHAGFNGLMLPVLEDSILAERVQNGKLTVKDLLLYSSVCGTGLDTIPLPGDINPEEIQSILLDVAALSSRLDKPLTARLMPIPGKKAGEETNYDFEFFANSSVMEVDTQLLSAPLISKQDIFLSPRKNH